MMLRIALSIAALALTGASPPQTHTEAPLRILMTNDDGVSSEGIAALVAALRPVADVVVAAPAENNSGGSQSVTIFVKPMQVDTLASTDGVARYAVHGTPADSVIFGLLGPGRQRPFDLVISGINKGENVGNAVHVSGTVGAARQAVLMGVPAIAVSQQYRADGRYDFRVAARYATRLAEQLHRMGKAAPRFVSVNVPSEANGVRVVPAAGSSFTMSGLRQVGQQGPGSALYRLDFAPGAAGQPGSDAGEIARGYITVSVLSTDANDRRANQELKNRRAIASIPVR
jgi:5'-nucleotidase